MAASARRRRVTCCTRLIRARTSARPSCSRDTRRPNDALIDERAEAEMQSVIELVSRVRNIRTEMNIKPGESISALIIAAPMRVRVTSSEQAAADHAACARVREFKDQRSDKNDVPRASARAVLAGGAEVAVPLEGLIDFAQERARLAREREKLEKELQKLEAQLSNPQFVERAPGREGRGTRQRVGRHRQTNQGFGADAGGIRRMNWLDEGALFRRSARS